MSATMTSTGALPQGDLLMTPAEVERLSQYQDLWFEDGSIVIAAQATSYRLHRGVLARHCGVFRDMFSVPQGGQSLIAHGCPVVQLHDRSEHLTKFFTLIYDGAKDPFFHRHEAVEFKDLRTLLRLSYKYDVPHIQAECLFRLTARFSPALATYDKERYLDRYIQLRRVDAIAVVCLARQYHALAGILPVALFECCQLPKEQLVASVQYDDGEDEQLAPGDLWLCLAALDPLAEQSNWIRERLLDKDVWPKENCTRRKECRNAHEELAQALIEQSASKLHSTSTNPLLRVEVTIVLAAKGIALCENCKQEFANLQGFERGQVWRGLDKLFGCEPGSTMSLI